jgi:hypothetical protein
MPSRFRPGAAAYAKDGRRYLVEQVEDGVVYCRSAAGAETEFAEAQLLSEAEWTARSGNQVDRVYATIRQSPAYAPYKGKLNPAAADRLLAKVDRVAPGILDFAALVTAERILAEAGLGTTDSALSIVKCRTIFDAAPPESRAVVLAGLIGSPPEVLVGAAGLGDNLLRAMIERAAAPGSVSFEVFRARRRR